MIKAIEMRLYKAFVFFLFMHTVGLQAQEADGATKFVGEIIETDPVYNGGLEEFYNYVYSNIPKSNDLKGRFFVSFFIEEDGRVSEVKLLKGISKDIDQKMITVLQKMPNWTPARLKNTAIRKKQVIQIGY